MSLVARVCAASLTSITVVSLIQIATGDKHFIVSVLIAALSFQAWDVFRGVFYDKADE